MSKPPLLKQPLPPKWEKEHLWLYLLALGFDPRGAAAAGKKSIHLHLGPDMFDKPNKDAFHLVSFFLFSKLDQSHCNEVFRFCFPPADKKTDSEFRKQCCDWLRKISDEYGNNFPSVYASLFLSPGGPNFIHLMFHFARCVLLHHIKTDSARVPESLNLKSPDLHMAAAKYCVAHHRFLQNLQKEDVIIQELQKKVLVFSKQIRDLRYENSELDKQLQKAEKNIDQSQNNTTEDVKKVRSMWESILETIKRLQKERQVVDSVVNGHVGQYTLDGASTTVSVPRLLLEKVEKEMHKLQIGNIYEAGRLNILTVLELLNNALEMLMLERQHIEKNSLKLDFQFFEGKTKFQNETLLGLESLRHKLKHEDHVSINQSIAEKQREWDLKWENCLGESPFLFIKEPNPALDLLPAMPPLSFTPTTEEAYKSSIFCQYPASIPDLTKKLIQTNEFKKDSEPLRSEVSASSVITDRNVTSSHCATEPENGMQIPSEKGSTIETPKRIEYSSSQILKYKGRNKQTDASRKRHADMSKKPSSVKSEDPLKKAQEQPADIVADAVVSDLSQKGKELDGLIGTLAFNPFLTRKQIPLTPENLITEIRSSWKKAIQAEEPSSMELHHAALSEHMPQDEVPVLRNRIDSSMACFMSLCMSDTVKSPFQEIQSPFRLQEVGTSPNELRSQQADVDSLDDQMYCKEGLVCTFPNKYKTENPELALESFNEPDCGPEGDFAKEIQPSYLCQNSSMHTTLSWDASQKSNFNLNSQEDIHLGILQETLQEEGGGESSISEAEEVTEENTIRDHIFADNPGKKEQRLDFQSIQNRYKALKKTFAENQESPEIPRARSEFSLTQTSLGTDYVFSPMGKSYALDAELVKKPSHETLLERRVSLSPLDAFAPVHPRDRLSRQDQGDVLRNVKS
ncbi:HAUS augmin-like complex subunit 6 isoform X2 [Heteronotia binoei]|uniref:HAUS augmin-like complex subunit 6 isoform X1 n=1 Tax=Heteronotia binoei TaxID=13085 RepID=UPI002930C800|nr:HAUS augmin-like complex subunit 6 isoform X1 [Heteronotia binoei]XP_060093227.1 HAUS augmin-like complex subunit 6 isoform X2 [Heteronotia binoei]